MTKNATSRFPIHKIIGERWSPHGFSTRLPEREKLQSIFEAARWAPSSRNSQPWKFMIFNRNNPDTYNSILRSLSDGDRDWAQNAPILVLALAKLQYDNSDDPNQYARYEAGMAVQNLLLQSTEQGLISHQIFFVDPHESITNTGPTPDN